MPSVTCHWNSSGLVLPDRAWHLIPHFHFTHSFPSQSSIDCINLTSFKSYRHNTETFGTILYWCKALFEYMDLLVAGYLGWHTTLIDFCIWCKIYGMFDLTDVLEYEVSVMSCQTMWKSWTLKQQFVIFAEQVQQLQDNGNFISQNSIELVSWSDWEWAAWDSWCMKMYQVPTTAQPTGQMWYCNLKKNPKDQKMHPP